VPAYVVVEISVQDAETYERYKELAPPSIAKHGGRYLVRGGATRPLEGDWRPSRFVVLEFPSTGDAERWWSSPEYADAKALRHASARSSMLLAEGVEPGALADGFGDHEGRPGPDEYGAFYAAYVADVPAGGIVALLARQVEDTCRLLEGLPDSRAEHAYAPGKWTIKEVVGHLVDSERVFSYRALRFARGDGAELPGFDEKHYVPAGEFGDRSLASLLDELRTVRRSTVALLGNLPSGAWLRKGIASGHPVSVRAIACIIAGHELHHRRILEERYLVDAPA
jgi:uncharacterized protein (DUF1330 family)